MSVFNWVEILLLWKWTQTMLPGFFCFSETCFQNVQIWPGSGLIYDDQLRNVLYVYEYCIASELIDEQHSDLKG